MPEATASFEDRRAFAWRILVRLWEEFGENPEQCLSLHPDYSAD
jgi:hypothetical protein